MPSSSLQQRIKYNERKEKHLCVRCGKPAFENLIYCKECREKSILKQRKSYNKEKETERKRKYYNKYKQNNLCVRCGKPIEEERLGRVYSYECSRKTEYGCLHDCENCKFDDCIFDEEKYFNKVRKRREKRKEKQRERYDNHVCILCGKELTGNNRYLCVDCRNKKNERKRKRRKEIREKNLREDKFYYSQKRLLKDMNKGVLCLICNEPVVEGKCYCEKHLKEIQERKKHSFDKINRERQVKHHLLKLLEKRNKID